jgi:HSP20 family molecular chaperone IbpA
MDDFDDIIDRIKKHFKIDSDTFDVDFLFIPESEKGLDLNPKRNNMKGFKISYHFERGMEKPDIKIKGNIDKRQIRDYLKNIDVSKYPSLKKLFDFNSKQEIDVKNLSLDFNEHNIHLPVLEPNTEINDYSNYSEIVLDIPGMSRHDIKVDINDRGTELLFTAENKNRKYSKVITLPFKCTLENCEIEVKNGLAIIDIKRSNN